MLIIMQQWKLQIIIIISITYTIGYRSTGASSTCMGGKERLFNFETTGAGIYCHAILVAQVLISIPKQLTTTKIPQQFQTSPNF